jgi:uncharacterized lipoprotein YddW (UPF0748 family)
MHRWIRVSFCMAIILGVMVIGSHGAEMDQEARAFWVVRNRITTPEKIRTIVETAKEYHFNTLIVQVHGRGDAYYHSEIDPRAEDLAGQDPDFDPLAMILELGHEAGLEVHAWVNAIYIWSKETEPVSRQHVLHRHPEWIMWDDEGRSLATYTRRDVAAKGIEGKYVDPSREDVLDYLHSVYMEVVTKYPVDGIHFDYIRYPGVHFGYSEPFCREFEEKWGIDPRHISDAAKSWAASTHLSGSGPLLDRWNYIHYARWNKAKCNRITELVRRVSRSVKELKPEVKVSAAVFPDPGTAYWRVSQDWRRWLEEGLLDMVCPMIYSGEPELVAKRAAAAVESAEPYGRLVYAGLGAWQKDPDVIIDEIRRIRKLGAAGFSLFAFWPVAEEEGYLETLRDEVFSRPAAIPPVPGGQPSGGK